MRARALFALAAVCLASATPARAYGPSAPASDPGVTSRTIALGGVIDQSGRGTVISTHILAGYRLALDEVNAAGGVNGRTIDYTALDDSYNPSNTLPAVKQLVESDNVFAVMGVFGSDDSAAALPYLESRHVPFFDPIGGGVDIKGRSWVWQTEPDYGREGAVMARYIAQTLHARRVGVLYQVGIGEAQRDALKRTLPKYGASVVGVASYQSTDGNLSGQVIRLRSAHPDIVVLNGTPTPTTAFVQYARLLGFKPKDGFFANYPMGDPLWIALIGKENAEGVHVTSYADLTGKNKVAAAYRKAIARFHSEPYSNYGLYGYFNAMLFVRALKLTGKHLTRARLQKTLDTRFRHFNTGFAGTFNWTGRSRYGAREFKVYVIRNGSFVPVTSWLKA